jgi:hypothetical protein
VRYEGSGASGLLALGGNWTVRPAPELMEALEPLVGVDGMQLLYSPAGTH